jgi:hypothetical protein
LLNSLIKKTSLAEYHLPLVPLAGIEHTLI